MDKNRLDRAIRKVMALKAEKGIPIAIIEVAKEFEINPDYLRGEMRKRSVAVRASRRHQRLTDAGNLKELCRECGSPIERGENRCSQCGADTSYIMWEDLTIGEIVSHIKVLCESGLSASQGMALRKALKTFSRAMYKNLDSFKRPIDESLKIEVKRRQ